MRYVGFFVALVYVALGVAVILKQDELFYVPKNYIIPLGTVLIAYGLFRGYRVYHRYFLE
jgi:hypothetical protein